MLYSELIKYIHDKDFKRILVTGSHRSGTTFAASCIAHDTENIFFPEENISFGNPYKLKQFLAFHSRFVLQAPAISLFCHQYNFDLIIYMDRDIKDIILSMKSLPDRLIQDQYNIISELYGTYYLDYSLPYAKRMIFNNLQIQHIENPVFLQYESLKKHPFWIPKPERTNWHIRQISNY